MLELNLNHESKRGPGHRSQHLNLDYLNANWTNVNALHQNFDYLFFSKQVFLKRRLNNNGHIVSIPLHHVVLWDYIW